MEKYGISIKPNEFGKVELQLWKNEGNDRDEDVNFITTDDFFEIINLIDALKIDQSKIEMLFRDDEGALFDADPEHPANLDISDFKNFRINKNGDCVGEDKWGDKVVFPKDKYIFSAGGY